MHCVSPRAVEIFLNSGVTFRFHPLQLSPAPITQWIKLTRVLYGMIKNAIKSNLSEYGNVIKMKKVLVYRIGI